MKPAVKLEMKKKNQVDIHDGKKIYRPVFIIALVYIVDRIF